MRITLCKRRIKKEDANKMTNHACTALLIFEKEESAFLAEYRASEFDMRLKAITKY